MQQNHSTNTAKNSNVFPVQPDSIACPPEWAATHVTQTMAVSLCLQPYFGYTRCEAEITDQVSSTTQNVSATPSFGLRTVLHVGFFIYKGHA